MIKRMPSGFRERRKPNTRGMQRGPSKSSGLQKLLAVCEGETLEEILAQPSLGSSGQPAEVSQVVTHLLDEFHFLIQEVVLQEVTEMRVCAGRTQGMQIPKGLVQVFSMTVTAS